MKVHHIGYLVKNIEASLERFIVLGYKIEHAKELDKLRDIYILFLKNGDYRVELIQPASEASEFAAFMKRFRNLPYHLCYETCDMEREIERLQQQRYHLIQDPKEAPCIDGRKVAFLQHPEIGIVELLETD